MSCKTNVPIVILAAGSSSRMDENVLFKPNKLFKKKLRIAM